MFKYLLFFILATPSTTLFAQENKQTYEKIKTHDGTVYITYDSNKKVQKVKRAPSDSSPDLNCGKELIDYTFAKAVSDYYENKYMESEKNLMTRLLGLLREKYCSFSTKKNDKACTSESYSPTIHVPQLANFAYEIHMDASDTYSLCVNKATGIIHSDNVPKIDTAI